MRRAVFAIPGDLATVTGGYIYERRLLEGLRELGVDVRHLPLGDSFPDPSAEHHDYAVTQLRAVDASTPLILDGFVFGSLDPDAFASLAAPVVGVVHHPLAHEEGLSDDRRAHLFHTERANVARAAAILVPSPHTARILVAEYGADPARVHVARPGTDRPGGERRPDDPPLILSVGIQHPRKGHDVLLRALARIRDLPWRAVIVGSPYEPAYAASLRALRDELGLAGRMELAGEVTSAQRDALYGRARVFALATRYEGYGLVLDEALSWGLPIVSCRTGAVPETVPETAALLVPPDDPAAFSAALREALDDDRGRMMANASAHAGASLPTWLDTARGAAEVLRSL